MQDKADVDGDTCTWCDEPADDKLGPVVDGYHARCVAAADEFMERMAE